MKLANLVRLNESEKKWDSLDVSRKAEKELSNSEWNKRVAEKLAILKKLNSDSKFKKDWDEETLQGWVDKNYSWEKVEGKFKSLNEGFGSGVTPEEEAIWQQFLKDNPGVTIGDIMKNPEIRSIWRRRASDKGPDVKYIGGDLDNATIELEGKVYNNVSFEYEDEINTGRMAYDEPIRHEYIAKVDGATFTVETESFGEEGEREVQWDTLEAEFKTTDEGSCGYSQEAPGGDDLKTPGDTQGMDGDDRTRAILRKLIRKEIANLQKEEPNEGNAFGAALQQAKDAGEEEFEFQGKKYTT